MTTLNDAIARLVRAIEEAREVAVAEATDLTGMKVNLRQVGGVLERDSVTTAEQIRALARKGA